MVLRFKLCYIVTIIIKPPTQQHQAAADLVLVWSWNNREGKHWPLAVAELVSVLQTLFQIYRRHAQLGTEDRGPRTVDMRAEVWRWMATINYLAAQPPVTTTSKLYLHHWGSRLQHLILLYFGASWCKVYSWDLQILSCPTFKTFNISEIKLYNLIKVMRSLSFHGLNTRNHVTSCECFSHINKKTAEKNNKKGLCGVYSVVFEAL